MHPRLGSALLAAALSVSIALARRPAIAQRPPAATPGVPLAPANFVRDLRRQCPQRPATAASATPPTLTPPSFQWLTWGLAGPPVANAFPAIDREYSVAARLLRQTLSTDPAFGALALRVARLLRERLLLADGRHDAAEASNATRELERLLAEVIERLGTDPNIDQMLFLRARALTSLGDMAGARRGYFMLIQRFPSSPYVPAAYFNFGAYFIESGDRSSALQFFHRVLQFGPATNALWVPALLRVAEIQRLDGNRTAANASFASLALALANDPTRLDRAMLEAAALDGFCSTLAPHP